MLVGILLASWLFPLSFVTIGTAQSTVLISVVDAYPTLSFSSPVGLYAPTDNTSYIFIVEQTGQIQVITTNTTSVSNHVFLDLSAKILYGGEQGLLGLAFHPNYSSNGYFYVDYTADTPRRTVIARYTVDSGNPTQADPSSEQIILEVEQPEANHNGGQIAFGPDGYLYIGLGDGGGAGDPSNHAQNRSTLLGAILRINVDTGSPYTVPSSNPFFGNSQGFQPEIFAYGLRNPWRFSFDTLTGALWLGDVGQGLWEEIDIIEKGNNYGWNRMEGNHCYNPGINCNTTGLELPVYEYDHAIGRSITGGYVYRGTQIPSLYGWYIYGDYATGVIWALNLSSSQPPVNIEVASTNLLISSFGVDAAGELYFTAFDDHIYLLRTATSNEPPPVPTLIDLLIPILGIAVASIVTLIVIITYRRNKISPV